MAVGGDREILLQCYNFGCGKTFNPATITDTSCCFHLDHPVFHNALKGWSCCKKRIVHTSQSSWTSWGARRGGAATWSRSSRRRRPKRRWKCRRWSTSQLRSLRRDVDEERKLMKVVTKSSYNQKKVDAKVADVVSDEIKIGTTCFNKGLFECFVWYCFIY